MFMQKMNGILYSRKVWWGESFWQIYHFQVFVGKSLVNEYTLGLINFEDKKFRGLFGYLLNHEIKYPRNFLYTHTDKDQLATSHDIVPPFFRNKSHRWFKTHVQ